MRRSHTRVLRLEFFFWTGAACLALSAMLDVFQSVHFKGTGLLIPQWLALGQLGIAIALCVMLLFIKSRFVSEYARAIELVREKEFRASTDMLTGAFSRHEFLARMNDRLDMIRQAHFHGGTASGFVYALIDVDNFKAINDTFGHTAGDAVLKTIVHAAQQRSNWEIGRLGGDEFGAILDLEDLNAAQLELDGFIQALRRVFREQDSHGFDGVSIGFALAPHHASLEADLMQAADMALHFAKGNGKGTAAAFSPEIRLEHAYEATLIRDLKAAILLEHLELHYQPLTDGRGTVLGAEALIRWPHPVLGNMAPSNFIPAAERHGLIYRVTLWVMRRACEDLEKSGFSRISINLSGQALKQPQLVNDLIAILDEHGCPASRFVLEITETVVVNANEKIIDTVNRLRNAGFRIALDDFGTGHCHFKELQQLPVDILKIDRSYIQQLDRDKVAQVFVAATYEIARVLQLVLVAEGVETVEQRELARMCGATVFQGYLEGRPRPLDHAIKSPKARSL